ncbi:hypothetical protein HAX54_051292, partial [Datura stramonium]|nr:hypothetical protein [Datura stramonium]
ARPKSSLPEKLKATIDDDYGLGDSPSIVCFHQWLVQKIVIECPEIQNMFGNQKNWSLDVGHIPGISDVAIFTIASTAQALTDLCLRFYFHVTDAAVKMLHHEEESGHPMFTVTSETTAAIYATPKSATTASSWWSHASTLSIKVPRARHMREKARGWNARAGGWNRGQGATGAALCTPLPCREWRVAPLLRHRERRVVDLPTPPPNIYLSV